MASTQVTTALQNICIQNNQTFFLLSHYKHSKKLQIWLLNVQDNEAFYGDTSDIELRSMAANIRMTYTEFLRDTLLAFSCNSGQIEFLYDFEKDKDFIYFKWKKKIDTIEMIITLGKIKLIKKDYSLLSVEVFSLISKELQNLTSEVKDLSASLAINETQRKNSIKLVSEANEMKANLENELYAKFLKILNNKKDKIRQLKEKMLHKDLNHNFNKNVNKITTSKTMNNEHLDDQMINKNNIDYSVSKPGPSFKRQSLDFLDEIESNIPIKISKPRNRKPYEAIGASKAPSNFLNPTLIENDESDNELLDLM